MAGFELKEGLYEDREVSEDEMWSSIACVFTSESKNDASYKFGFLKAILDNFDKVNKDYVLTFDQLFSRFAELYWSLILEHNISQKAATRHKRKSAIERVLLEAKDKYLVDDFVEFDNLPAKARTDVIHKVKMECKKYVVGALFETTRHLFYSFSKKDEWIKLNPRMYSFISKRKEEVDKLNCYEWAHFLSKVNPMYSTGEILNRFLLKSRKSKVNTTELLIEAETLISNPAEQKNKNDGAVIKKEIRESIVNVEIDEEAMALLDDPISLIKLLKKRRGI